jgi:ribonuclease P protein component
MHSFRHPKSHRITRRADYLALYKDGFRASTRQLRIHVLICQTDEPPRLGIAVTNQLKQASSRNLLKRRFREIFRLHQHELKAGARIVIVAKPGSQELDFKTLERDLLYLFKKARVIKDRGVPQ